MTWDLPWHGVLLGFFVRFWYFCHGLGLVLVGCFWFFLLFPSSKCQCFCILSLPSHLWWLPVFSWALFSDHPIRSDGCGLEDCSSVCTWTVVPSQQFLYYVVVCMQTWFWFSHCQLRRMLHLFCFVLFLSGCILLIPNMFVKNTVYLFLSLYCIIPL